MLVINKKWHHLLHACASALSRICLLQQCDDGQLLNNPPQKKVIWFHTKKDLGLVPSSREPIHPQIVPPSEVVLSRGGNGSWVCRPH